MARANSATSAEARGPALRYDRRSAGGRALLCVRAEKLRGGRMFLRRTGGDRPRCMCVMRQGLPAGCLQLRFQAFQRGNVQLRLST